MYKIMAFIYQNNKQVKDEFRKMLIDKDVTMSQVAERLEIIPQQLNNRFNNKRISLSDLQAWLNTVIWERILGISHFIYRAGTYPAYYFVFLFPVLPPSCR